MNQKEDIKPMIVFRPPFKGKDLWKIELSRPTPTKIQKDMNNEMVLEIYRTNLSVWSEFLKKTQSDQLRLSVNKADGNISVILIPKST
jgi:regulatory protein YycH of two-component signal transduction system YycFG